MLHHWIGQIKKWLGERRGVSPPVMLVYRKRGRVRLRLEELEDRLVPATISDGGTAALSIVLGASENLTIVSNGSSYTFTSNQNFTANTGTDPAGHATAFGGIGTMTLTLTSVGIAQYATGINITDAGAGDTVNFNNSGANSYGNNFNVTQSNAGAGGIGFRGTSNFGAFNLLASTTLGITANSGSDLSSSSGNLTLLANLQTIPNSGGVNGITVNNATIQSTSTGQITLQGKGSSGSSAHYFGIYIEGTASVMGGTGTVVVNGIGGATPNGGDSGVALISSGGSCSITSSGGDIKITGQGGGAGSSGSNDGIQLQGGTNPAVVTAGGNGNVILTGTGGPTTGTSSYGVFQQGFISSTGGNVTITGIENNSSEVGLYFSNSGSNQISTSSPAGTITLICDSITYGQVFASSSTITAATGAISIVPRTIGTQINLGSNGGTNGLILTSALVSHITAGTLQIGNSSSGDLTVTGAIDATGAANVQLLSSGAVDLNSGSLKTGGTLTLSPGASSSVKPLLGSVPMNFTVNTLGLSSGSTLAVTVNGTSANSQYSQINVVGNVNLSGTNLLLSGTLVPADGQTFTIVNNNGTQPVIGTFSGLPEGAIIPNFLGSNLSATISYVGGAGHDVVLYVGQAALTTTQVIASSAHISYGQTVTLTATVNSAVGTPPGNVEFFDGTTAMDLGAGTLVNSGAGAATWVLTTAATQVQATGGRADVIRAVFTSTGNFFGSSSTLAGGLVCAPVPLTITGLKAFNKVYDGTTAASLNFYDANGVYDLNLVGFVGGDSVSAVVNAPTGTFVTKDAGNNIQVNTSGLMTLVGPLAIDYTIIDPTTTANITPAPVTIVGVKADKAYDGTTAATLDASSASLAGVFSGDAVNLATNNPTGVFTNAGPGNNIPVSVLGFSITGPQAADYALVQPTTIPANITLAPGSVSDYGTGLLYIALATNQTCAVVSNGTGYTITSNQTLSARNSTDPTNQSADFTGLGTKTLTLTSAGIAQYAMGIEIVDEGPGTSVTFNNSATNAYSNNINVALTNTAAGAVIFNGNSTFDSFNLQAFTTANIFVNSSANLSFTSGNLTLADNQQGTSISGGNQSAITINGTIQSSGTGTINLQGQAAGTGFSNIGVNIAGGKLVGTTGKVTVQGTGGGAASTNGQSNVGVEIGNNGSISTSLADVQVTGSQGNGIGNDSINMNSLGNITAGGTISLTGNFMRFSSASVNAGAGTVALVPLTSGTAINLGLNQQVGPLGLTNDELNLITAGTLQIGDSNSGAIVVTAPITLSKTTNVVLTSGSDIVFSLGSLNTGGGNLTLSPGSTHAVGPTNNAVNAITGSGTLAFTPGSNLAITIGLPHPLFVQGIINLTGVNLLLSGNLTPAVGQSFTIVNNAGNSPITGIFNGLPERAVIPNFLGSGLGAMITYQGGDGNDVVLTVVPPIDHFALIPATSNTTAGAYFAMLVIAEDANNQPVNYSGPVVMTSNDPQGPSEGTINLAGGYAAAPITLDTTTAIGWNITATIATIFTASAAIMVAPGAATSFVVTAPTTATTGSAFTITIKAQDAFGNAATGYTGTVKFTSTDIAFAPISNYTFTGSGAGQDNGLHTFTSGLTLRTPGNQKITVTDITATNPTVSGTSSPIAVSGLEVTAFTPTPTGFTASFSKAFIPNDLTLYGANKTTVQDVTLVGTHVGPIHGSLVIDPSNMSVTFKATASYLLELNGVAQSATVSAVLPDDTYKVTLVSGSGANGFIDALGAHLDGGKNGGHANFTTSFTTQYQANATPVLGIPDFARGPDSNAPIKVPNDSANGVPLTLYYAANVTDVTFSLTYNPSLLNITGTLFGLASDATDAAATLTLVSNAGGVATFHYIDANPQSATALTPLVLGDIVAVVPSGAGAPALSLYQTKELLQLGNIVINQGTITGAVSANGVHVDAYFGDVTGDKAVDGLDKLSADNVAQGRGTGFSAYVQLDPVIIGDVAGDLSVDAGDVSAFDSFVAQLHPAQIPQPPTQLLTTDPNYVNPSSIHSPNAADPTLSLRGLTAVGSPVVSVTIDHPDPEGSTGLTSVTLALTYDPALLSVSAADITLGSIPSGGTGWQLTAVVDQATGQIGIQLYSLTPITVNQAGSLVNIAFQLNGEPTGVSSQIIQLVDAVTPNGQWFGTGIADAQGAMILSTGVDQLALPTSAKDERGKPIVP